jgi:hypothetical protein
MITRNWRSSIDSGRITAGNFFWPSKRAIRMNNCAVGRRIISEVAYLQALLRPSISSNCS